MIDRGAEISPPRIFFLRGGDRYSDRSATPNVVGGVWTIMAYALLDVLNGRFVDGTPVAGADTLLRSVQDHLRRLLNARQGVLRHLPDYGLPDVPALYAGLPYSGKELAEAVRRTVARFEPRLSEVSADVVRIKGRKYILGIEVSGRLPGGEWARFQSQFHTSGSADVSAVPAREVNDA